MTHPLQKSLLALAAAALGAAAFAGCGNDVPAGAVAKVGDSTITEDEFEKWLSTAAKGNAQGGAAAVPDPPDFTKCVAAKGKTPVPKGQEKPSEGALKKQCKTEYDALKREVMQFLIQAEWVQQEAAEQDIKVSDKEIESSFADQKKQAFPNDKQYKEFLASSGMTEDDILFRVKLDQLQQKLTQKVTEDAKKVSDDDISTYYEKNKKRFAQPERRDLRVVLTKTEAKANQAKRALSSGQSFKTVVKRYSIDEASKSQAGLLPAVSEGQQEKAFDSAIFAADEGQGRGSGQDAVRLVRLQGGEGHQGVPADARPVQGDDQEPAALPAPAEGARRVHQVLPRGLQGRDRLRGRLPGRRVQERSEG